MINKNLKIIELFQNNFAEFESFSEKQNQVAFKCDCKKNCNVDLTKEAAYTGIIGDENTDVMIVAESPSTRSGKGCYTAGNIDELMKGNDKNLISLIEFIKNKVSNNYNPYFTDTIKCGLEKTREKEKLNNRLSICSEKFLRKEIDIIQPRLIVCLGAHSYNLLSKLKQEKKIRQNIDLIKLHHYSNRASLTLTIEDKTEIIWPLQFNLLNKRDAATKALTIKHLKEMINKLENE